jgi:ABC-2 type transport system permease protein
MISSILSLARMDLLLWRRSPLTILSALIPPVAMTAMLVILSLTVLQQPVALVVNSHGPHTERMQKIIQADDDAYILTLADEATAQQLLRSQLIAAVITIPEDFERNVPLYKGKVNYTLNNMNIDFSDDIRRSIDRSVAQFDAPELGNEGLHGDEAEEHEAIVEQRIAAGSQQKDTYLIKVKEFDLRETNVEWLHYQVLPALILLILNVGLMGTALLCSQDVERRTARYLLITPLSSITLVLGRFLGGFLASVIVLLPAIAICIATNLINPPLQHWPALIGIFVLTAICAAGIGACIGTLIRGVRTVAMTGSMVATYLFILGGGFTTIEFLPQWLRTMSSYDPVRYSIDGMRQALFYGTLDGVGKDLLILSITALVAIVIGTLSIQRTFRE